MIQHKLSRIGIDWIWFPFSASLPHRGDDLLNVRNLYVSIKERLDNPRRIYNHCSAGIYRTGMITYGLLQFLGNDLEKAHRILPALRQVTSDEAGEERLAWCDVFYTF